VYLKKSELILPATCSAGGIPPEPPFRPPRLEAEAKRQPPKNLKKCRLELYFGQKRAFLKWIEENHVLC